MPEDEPVRHRRKNSGKETILSKDSRKKPSDHESAAVGELPPDKPATLDALRKARLDHLSQTPEERRRKMKLDYISEAVTKAPAKKEDVRYVRRVTESRKRQKPAESDRKHRHHKVRVTERRREDSDEEQYVYGRQQNTKRTGKEPRKAEIDTVPEDSVRELPRQKTRRVPTSKPERDHQERQIPRRRQAEPIKGRYSYVRDERDPTPRTTSPLAETRVSSRKSTSGPAQRETDRPPPPKSATSRTMREEERPSHARSTTSKSVRDEQRLRHHRTSTTTSVRDKERPQLKRSATTTRTKPDATTSRTSLVTPEYARKGSSLFSSFLRPAASPPEKQISCLTCGSDDVPISRSAKLACSHRMCHDCLRRIFTMSVTDPAHMPPRCCTSEHIPLKHVDRLFDQKFKKTWNRKFLEYTAKNRIYCPARGCGEWIKPNHIIIEHGRKVGRCKRCSTRVCCICNNRMHVSRDCPEDPATKEFIETAKQSGWQKCHNCSAMVELKEGCNHMTCRCTAEFCMVCGAKWKTCDCPWFNYEAVDQHLGNPARYQQELDRRRAQEQRDAEFARRMEMLNVEEEEDGTFGIGNAAGHHMNADFVQHARNLLTRTVNRRTARAAEGLLNGMITGRENPIPYMPMGRNETDQLLRGPARREHEPEIPLPPPLASRRTAFRRQSALGDLFDGRPQTADERASGERIANWNRGVPLGAPGV